MTKQIEVWSTVEALSVVDTLKMALEALRDYRRSDDDRVSVAMGILQDALAEQPAQQHIEHCLWARNGNQPCPHVQPAQQQEPVAWIFKPNMELLWPDEIEVKDPSKHRGYKPLYTSPQPAQPSQRSVKPWVGLSTDEIYDMYNEPRSDAEMVEFAQAIEAKLREKNA